MPRPVCENFTTSTDSTPDRQAISQPTKTSILNTNLKNEFDSLLPGAATEAGASRRTALKAALGVGYAATAMPIMAQTAINTSSDGLKTGETSFEVNGFKVPAFYAAPAGKTNLPVILVIQEIFGVHEYMADTARRFAKAGYLAIAPELFARQGDPTQYAEVAKLMAEVVASIKKGLYATNFGGGQVDITSGKFVFSASEAYWVENGKILYPVKGATIVGNGPDSLTRVTMIGNDMRLDSGVGTCGKEGQSVPVGVGQPTLRIDGLTVGGTA